MEIKIDATVTWPANTCLISFFWTTANENRKKRRKCNQKAEEALRLWDWDSLFTFTSRRGYSRAKNMSEMFGFALVFTLCELIVTDIRRRNIAVILLTETSSHVISLHSTFSIVFCSLAVSHHRQVLREGRIPLTINIDRAKRSGC